MPKQPWPPEAAAEWGPIVEGIIELVRDINILRKTVTGRRPNTTLIKRLMPKIQADAEHLHHLFGLVKFHYENDRAHGERWPRWVLYGFEIGLNCSDRIRNSCRIMERAYSRQNTWSYLEKLTLAIFEDAMEISRTVITEGGPAPINQEPIDEWADVAGDAFGSDDELTT